MWRASKTNLNDVLSIENSINEFNSRFSSTVDILNLDCPEFLTVTYAPDDAYIVSLPYLIAQGRFSDRYDQWYRGADISSWLCGAWEQIYWRRLQRVDTASSETR